MGIFKFQINTIASWKKQKKNNLFHLFNNINSTVDTNQRFSNMELFVKY